MNDNDLVTKTYLDEALDKVLAKVTEAIYDSETRLLRALTDASRLMKLEDRPPHRAA